MTEAEWMACNDPTPMLKHLGGKTTGRKRLLFGVACCRAIRDLLTDNRSRMALEAVEGWIEGATETDQLEAAWLAAHDAVIQTPANGKGAPRAALGIGLAAWHFRDNQDRLRELVEPDGCFDNQGETADTVWSISFDAAEASSADRNGTLSLHARFLRCIIGNPLRPPPQFDLAWLTWNDGAVRKMAQAIYDARAFDRLPLLADALEDAGCADAAILSHCRGPGEHVRGCWVVDLVLGKT